MPMGLRSLASLLISWTRARYSPLTLWQWMVGFGLGLDTGAKPGERLAGLATGAGGDRLSFLSLTVAAWTLRRLGVGSSATVEQAPASKTARLARAV